MFFPLPPSPSRLWRLPLAQDNRVCRGAAGWGPASSGCPPGSGSGLCSPHVHRWGWWSSWQCTLQPRMDTHKHTRVISWLIDSWIDWLADWLTRGCIYQLTECVDWQWLTDGQCDWLIPWSLCRGLWVHLSPGHGWTQTSSPPQSVSHRGTSGSSWSGSQIWQTTQKGKKEKLLYCVCVCGCVCAVAAGEHYSRWGCEKCSVNSVTILIQYNTNCMIKFSVK